MQTDGLPPVGGQDVSDITTALGGGSLAVLAWLVSQWLRFIRETREADLVARAADREVLASVSKALDRNTDVLQQNTQAMQAMMQHLQQSQQVPRGL